MEKIGTHQRQPLAPCKPNDLRESRRKDCLDLLKKAIASQDIENMEMAYQKSSEFTLGQRQVKEISTLVLREQSFAMFAWLEPKIKFKWILFKCAIAEKNEGYITHLLEKYPKLLDKIYQRVQVGDIDFIKSLFDAEYIPPNKFGRNVLHEAALRGQSEIVEFLVNRAPYLDHPDEEEFYPIDYAVKANSRKSVELLLPKYLAIEKSIIEAGETTPLSYAIENQMEEMVETLVKGGVDLCSFADSSRTPFLLAILSRSLKMMDTILQAGGHKAARPDIEGNTPTHYATGESFLEGLEYLRSKGLIDLSVNHYEESPVDLALKNRALPEEFFAFFYEENKALFLTEPDQNGTTRLHHLVKRRFATSLKKIIHSNRSSESSYMPYLQNRELGSRKKLVNEYLWVRDDQGNTIFHEAAKIGDLQILQMLYHLDPEFFLAKNDAGETWVNCMNYSLAVEFCKLVAEK